MVRNGLLFAPEQFTDHYLKNISILNKLQFVNPRSSKDTRTMINMVHSESTEILKFLKDPEELKKWREHFTYRGSRPKTKYVLVTRASFIG